MAEIPFEPYTGQSKLRFWCQKVLPLVYDDSLSYYELLGKVVEYLNNTISDVSACEDNITALRDAFVQLQDYVNEMFDDFAPEVERIIDEMVDSGEFAEILTDVINGVIASEYSTSQGYAQFDYVIKDGKLYCATASTSGEWDSTKWRETTIGADMQLLNQRVYNLNAGQVAYNSEGTYNNQTVGKELQDLKGYLNLLKGHIIVVGAYNADFATLSEAIAYAKQTYNVLTEDATIFIRNGTYIIPYNENSTANAPEAIDKGANRISIIGESKEHTILQITNTPAKSNCIIGVGGDCTIANITFNCLWNDDGSSVDYKRAYCIHNDYGYNYSYGTPYNTVIKNCKLYSECFNPIGAGLWQNQTQIYEECEFIWNPLSSEWTDNGAFYVHAPADSNATTCALIVRDCTAKSIGEHYACFLGNVSGSIGFNTIPVTIERSIFKNTGSHSIANFNRPDINLQITSELNSLDNVNKTYNKGINVISEIGSTANLNSFYAVYQAGLYYVNYAQNAPYPYGILFVMPYGESICFQLFFSTSGLNVFVRSRTGSSWSQWKNIVDGTWYNPS